jgi:hypothetical protein
MSSQTGTKFVPRVAAPQVNCKFLFDHDGGKRHSSSFFWRASLQRQAVGGDTERSQSSSLSPSSRQGRAGLGVALSWTMPPPAAELSSDAVTTTTTTTLPTMNVLMFSDAGKPLFARHGTDEEVAHMCGMLQGLRTAVLYGSMASGEIHSIVTAGGSAIVFLHFPTLSLAALSSSVDGGPHHSPVYLRAVLERVTAAVTLQWTGPALLEAPPQVAHTRVDVGRSTERLLHSLLDQIDAQHYVGVTLQPLYPLPLREQASLALRDACGADNNSNILFGLLCCGERLISLVQPSHAALHMRPADLILLLHVLAATPCVTTERWFPVCLPRFNNTGFLHCFTTCLDNRNDVATTTTTSTQIALLSHVGTTEQLRLLQAAVTRVRRRLGILEHDNNNNNNVAHPAAAVTTPASHLVVHDPQASSDLDYVDAAGEGENMIPYVGEGPSRFLQDVALALDPGVATKLHQDYLEVAQGLHFFFRYNVPVHHTKLGFRKTIVGRLPQSLTACRPSHFGDPASRRQLWTHYEELMLRLRLGSSSHESVQDALAMMVDNVGVAAASHPPPPASSQHCHAATALLESAPNFEGFTSTCDDNYLHVGINGDSFELFLTVASQDVSVKQAAALGAKLVRRLLLDKHQLFLCNPLVWKT